MHEYGTLNKTNNLYSMGIWYLKGTIGSCREGVWLCQPKQARPEYGDSGRGAIGSNMVPNLFRIKDIDFVSTYVAIVLD